MLFLAPLKFLDRICFFAVGFLAVIRFAAMDCLAVLPELVFFAVSLRGAGWLVFFWSAFFAGVFLAVTFLATAFFPAGDPARFVAADFVSRAFADLPLVDPAADVDD